MLHTDDNLLLKKEIMFKSYLKYVNNIKKTNFSIDNISFSELDNLFYIFDEVFNPDKIDILTDETYIILKEKLKAKITEKQNTLESEASKAVCNLIESTVRTNFYDNSYPIKKESDFSLVIKFDSTKLDYKPEFKSEFFVYNRFFEGVHFREKEIARGGIRLSSREDYFDEIFGLAKTQKYKNSMVVEGGAKGGFIIKSDYDDIERQPSVQEKTNFYKSFLTAILSVMDNKQSNGDFSCSSYVICLDEPDPYFFVAADKGTSLFLDQANAASSLKNFWLKDAFASGSSSGYNHKELQITSKGAIIAAEHHAKNLNMSLEGITVVGVGGMSGDVFGNAMIMMQKINLIAAFNHSYIFVDPSPDQAVSLEERQRLFKEGKSWNDYDLSKISQGGGVFKISDESIVVSEKMKKLFGIKKSKISGGGLVEVILKSKVDMLFLGGVDTYVVSKDEKKTSSLQVFGSDVKAKIVVEGANLGFTNAARIEYAKKGGMINTDFIDNCLGVCCSSYEVQLKLLNTGDKSIISKSQGDVIEKLSQIACNKNIGVYLEVFYSNKFTGDYNMYLKEFYKGGIVTRPEAAMLSALVVNYLKSKYHNLDVNQKYIDEYFPSSITSFYKENLDSFDFKNQIAVNFLINKMTNALGSYYVFKHSNIYNVNERDIIEILMKYDIEENCFDSIIKKYDNPKEVLKELDKINSYLKVQIKNKK